MTSRWSDGSRNPEGAAQYGKTNPASSPERSSSSGSGGYSLQGEEDLFRDPFADFKPSGR